MLDIGHSDLQIKLQKLKDLDLSITTYEEILGIINENLIPPILVAKISAGNYVERIRINKDDEIFFSPLELSYKPNSLINTFGRANSCGISIFYGAVISSAINLPRLVALAETEELLRGKNKGKLDKTFTITLGKWKITKDILLAEIVFQKEKINQLPELRKAYNFHIDLLRKKFSVEEVERIILLLEFYSEEFAKSEIYTDSDYKISAAYAESILKLETIQGIIYPSVRTDHAEAT